jgi:MFS transporter, putative metabolite:H+ symporter
MSKKNLAHGVISAPVIVAALGYFVDIYDLLLFSIVRRPSLVDLGVSESTLVSEGILLLNMQMAGMLIGGLLWGILGDKKGRLSVLFGSILMYSLANLANGMVQNLDQYAWLRFIAGIGLAGELGAGITLVAEVLPKEKRGYGTTLIATIGMLGAVVAYFVAATFDWRIAYFIGGGMGLCLLLLRVGVYESGVYTKMKQEVVSRGNFLSLFTKIDRLKRYAACIFIGIPIWFVVGILITFSPEFAKEMGLSIDVSAGKAVMYCYLGLALGDLASGLLSQVLRNRKKVVLSFVMLCMFAVLLYLWMPFGTVFFFYSCCLFLGFSSGYWALFVTMAAEQFGTNLRATVTTTVPNFIRGTVIPLTISFEFFRSLTGNMIQAASVTGLLVFLITFLAYTGLRETFTADLNFNEP